MFGRDKKYSQDLLISQILPGVLVFLVGRLFMTPGRFRKLTRWDFGRAVTQGCTEESTSP